MTGGGAAHAAAWTGPALLVFLASRAAAGHGEAPLLALVVMVAPLVGLLRPLAPAALPAATRLVVLATVGGVVWANVIVFADLAAMLGGARWQGAVLAATLTLLLTVRPAADRARALVLAAGVACVVAVVAAAGVTTGRTPWAAWAEVASRPALVFAAGAADARFTRATTLEFTEAHQVVALGAGPVRVAEREGTRTVVREWSVRAHDVLTLRPGDRLSLPAGARVRFEAGKRIPGAPASGAQWAAGAREAGRALPAGLGLALTLLGGAVALVPSRSRGGMAAVAPLVFGWAAVCGGTYAVAIAPELVLGSGTAAVLAGMPRAAPRAAAALFTLVGGAALALLLVASAQALRARVVGAAGASTPATWTAVFALAAAGAVWPIDAWLVLSAALGLAASAWAAPRLAAGGHQGANRWSPVGLGSIAGALAFGALAAAAARLPEWAGAAGDYPALVAAPMAWAVALMARRPSARTAAGTGRSPSATSDR
ncbi:MAG TPA: hypothetical protein VMR23_14315 [Candidatus Limnocylindria bacterium]|nr:hypothetical protein [Candidatus Limnocylindria bacterium]